MKKKQQSLKLYRTTIAWLNGPHRAGVQGGYEPLYYSKRNAYCGYIRDTATVPAITQAETCTGSPDTLPGRDGKSYTL